MSSPELEPAEVAAVLVRKAQEDATAVREFAANPRIGDGIIGFHAQQAIEKWLKAVVASRSEDFEHTHDLRHLTALAGLAAADSPFDIQQAIGLTEYAVPLRYEDLLDAEPLDREATTALVEEVGRWAEDAVENAGDPSASPTDAGD